MFNKSNVKDMYSLSPMQEGMLFHYIMEPSSPMYFEQMSYRINGPLNCHIFEKALNALIERYDVLRTVFIYKKASKPRQVLLKTRDTQIPVEDITNLSGAEQTEYIDTFKKRDREKGFELSRDIPLRVSILKCSETEYEIVWSFHHILMDGWCTVIMVREMMMIYSHLLSGQTQPLRLPPTTPYSFYIKWLEKQDKEKALEFWREYLYNYETPAGILGIPGLRREEMGYQRGVYSFVIDSSITSVLEQIAGKKNATMSTTFQVLWGLLLQEYNRTMDVVFGVVVSGRPPEIPGVDTMIGLFINNVPVRVCRKPGETFEQLLRGLQESNNRSLPFEYIPLADIQNTSGLKRNLLTHFVTFENYPVQREMETVGTEMSGITTDENRFFVSNVSTFAQTNYDMDLEVSQGAGILNVTIRYNGNLCHPSTMERLSGHLVEIARQVATQPAKSLDRLEIMTERERHEILDIFNQTLTPFPGNQTMVSLFREQVMRTPERVAVISADIALTYRELDNQTEKLSGILKEKGVQANEIMGILIKRSPYMMIGIMGMMKAGGAYLPISPGYPVERIRYLLADSQARFLVSTRDSLPGVDTIPGWTGEIIFLDDKLEPGNAALSPGENPGPGDLAYVIYTSGSTGQPKGVMIEHQPLVNRLYWMQKRYPLTVDDVILQKTPYIFDVSLWELFWWSFQGAAVFLLGHGEEKYPDKISEAIGQHQVTVMHFVPSMLNSFLEFLEGAVNRAGFSRQLKSLRRVFTSGESLVPFHAQRFDRLITREWGTALVNLYGPTEATVDVSYFDYPAGSEVEKIPIGRPIDNISLWVVEPTTGSRLQPVGIVGELLIGGVGLARGYLNRPELTEEKFVWSPFSFYPGRLYKTGDLAAWLADGNIEFFGRMDNQVKIRGYRIEPGEIEERLAKHEFIREVVVMPVLSGQGGEYSLCAYYVSSTLITMAEFNEYLSRDLPAHMIPSYFVHMEEMPHTATGKIDRKSLPAWDGSVHTGVPYEAPLSITEKVLAEIWEDILGIVGPGIRDNFFQLGGHSLKAIQMVSRIHKHFEKEISLAQLFNHPTIAALSAQVDRAEENVYAAIEAVEKMDYYPVSSAQNRLFVLQEIVEDNIVYNIPQVIVLPGQPDLNWLQECFSALIERHEALRTSFHIVDGFPVQRVHDPVHFVLEHHTVSESLTDRDDYTRETIAGFIRPFDLSQPPLIRAGILETGTGSCVLMVDMHHIISDAHSHQVLQTEFLQLLGGQPLPGLRIQYKDFSVWQRSRKESAPIRQQERWWLREMTGELPVTDLPYDFTRPVVYQFAGQSLGFEINNEQTRKLQEMAKVEGTTMYMLLLTIYYVFLAKITGQEELLVGTPVVGRRHVDLEKIIGMFVNMIPLRNYSQGTQPFSVLLKEINERTLAAFENQEYPFDDLVEKLEVERDTSRNPVFDVVFSFFDHELDERETSDNPYRYENKTAKFDLTLYSFAGAYRVYNLFEYSTHLFKESTIQRFIGYFQQVVEAVIRFPHRKISQVEIVSPAEKQWILFQLNDTAVGFPADQTIQQIFYRQVEQAPGHMAVVGHGDKNENLSYQQLDIQARYLALELKELGVGADVLVGMLLERSLEMIVGIMAILYAGGAYLPLDPAQPAERISYILQDSDTRVLLTQAGLITPVEFTGRVMDITSFSSTYSGSQAGYAANEPVDLFSTYSPQDTAYVIYTSGTTGRPKGVMVQHKNVVRLMINDRQPALFGFNSRDIWTMFHSYNFDFSVWEMYGALLFGGKLIIVPKMVAREPRLFADLLRRHSVTVLNQTPSAFNSLFQQEQQETVARSLFAVRMVVFGGEALNPGKLKWWVETYPETWLINMFGITETTVHVTYKRITLEDVQAGISNIGGPIPTTTVYILDAYQHLVPVGITGEIYVGGDGVARGYLNRPELTGERFIKNPYRENELLYRSGDLGKLLVNGEIEYLGRIDHQVQVRGFRVELGEIENQLLGHEAIGDAVVIAGNHDDETPYLCAYVVLRTAVLPGESSRLSDQLGPVELKAYLSEKLPEYMIPHYIMIVEYIPLTANGKINRKELPTPTVATGKDYISPTNDVQKALVDIWSEVLNVKEPGITDNYFNLGGDSIKAIQLIGRINKHFNSSIRIVDLYLQQSIEKLSYLIKPAVEETIDHEFKKALEEINQLRETVLAEHAQREMIDQVVPMSDIESAMLYYYSRESGQAVYHDQTAYHVPHPDFNIERMNRALTLLLEKHPILRTGFDWEHGAKIIFKTQSVDMQVMMEDLAHLSRQEQEAHILAYTLSSRNRPFNITVPPLWRMRYFKIDGFSIVIVWEFHHAIIDGWSNASFLTELNNLYIQLFNEPTAVPLPLAMSYPYFIARQMKEKRFLQTDAHVRQYWQNQLSGYKRLVFPLVTGPVQLKEMAIAVDLKIREQLVVLTRESQVEFRTLCFAAYGLMLSMFSYENDFVVGIVTNTRPEVEDGDKLLGCFLNTVPFRFKVDVDETPTWGNYLRWVNEAVLELKANEKCSLADIMSFTGERTQAANPYFDVYFNYINFYAYNEMNAAGTPANENEQAAAQETGPGVGLTLENYEKTNTAFDFAVRNTDAFMTLALYYSTGFVSEANARKCCDYFIAVLKKFAYELDSPMYKGALMSEAERERLVTTLNQTQADYPADKVLHQLFQEQVERTPGALSLIFDPSEGLVHPGVALNYRQLNAQANQLTRVLITRGVGPGHIVGILLERTEQLIIAILAVLKSGAAYLPMDMIYPAERLAFMVRDSQTKVIISRRTIIDTLDNFPAQVDVVDPFAARDFLPTHNLEDDGTEPGDPAYMIYTSGSTGRPKGVLIRHFNVANFIRAMVMRIPFAPGSRIVALTTISFDIFGLETWVPLTHGLTVVMADELQQNDPHLLEVVLQRNQVTMLQVTPSRLKIIVERPEGEKLLTGLQQLIVGGEAFPGTLYEVVKEVLSGSACRLFNVYGPTETTVWSTIKELTHVSTLTIGTPVANTQVYILDDHHQLLAEGAAGELCIGGEGVAGGYLNRPELTQERFIRISIPGDQPGNVGKLLYKTGDLVCWGVGDELEFIERIDHQVKIRGFRIELEEIEKVLLAHTFVSEVVVIAGKDSNGEGYLAAYIVSKMEPTVSELRDLLSKQLPNYMIPAYFIFIDAIPLTSNGKVDRKALPGIDGSRPRLETTYVEPKTEIEREIARLWGEVLGIENIGIQDNFFDLGGNSMDIMKLNSKLERLLERYIPVLTLFEHPTIGSLLEFLEKEKNQHLEGEMGEKPAGSVLLDNESEALQDAIALFDNV